VGSVLPRRHSHVHSNFFLSLNHPIVCFSVVFLVMPCLLELAQLPADHVGQSPIDLTSGFGLFPKTFSLSPACPGRSGPETLGTRQVSQPVNLNRVLTTLDGPVLGLVF